MARLTQEALNKLPYAEAKAYFMNWAEDLRAWRILVDLAESVYEGPGHAESNAAFASLMHAADYLADRIGYEMEPHPKGMIRLPGDVNG